MPGGRGRGRPRRPAALPLPDLGRVGGGGTARRAARIEGGPRRSRRSADRPGGAPRHAARRRPASRPADVLKRAGRRLGFFTVRDLLFHLPRRYDDLREMRQLGELVWVEDGTVVSRPRPGRRRPRRGARSGGGSSGRSRSSRTRPARSTRRGSGGGSSSAGCIPGDRVIVSRQAQALRPEADARQPRLPARGPGRRAAPRRADRAGLPADRRADREPAADRDARARSTGPASDYPEYLPAAIRDGRGARRDRRRRSRRPTTRRRSRAATRRSAGSRSTSCSRSSWGWSARRRQRGRDAARPIAVDDADDAGAARRRSTGSLARKLGRDVALTTDQDAAIAAIRDDLARPTPMLRLLQGDVGSRQDGGRGLRARGGGAGRAAGRAPRPDGPPRPAAPRDARRRCSRTRRSPSSC